jgi:hypothetical protein
MVPRMWRKRTMIYINLLQEYGGHNCEYGGDICGEAKPTSPRCLKYDPVAKEEATSIEVECVESSDIKHSADDNEETTSYSKQRSRAQEMVSVVRDSCIPARNSTRKVPPQTEGMATTMIIIMRLTMRMMITWI